MIYNYNKKLVPLAQKLRKGMTNEEKHLWYDFLKKLPITVNRQKNIGLYIVDFYISSKRTVIELDGIQHGREEQHDSDKVRDSELEKLGVKVLRYSNLQINNSFDEVRRDILKNIGISEEEFVLHINSPSRKEKT